MMNLLFNVRYTNIFLLWAARSYSKIAGNKTEKSASPSLLPKEMPPSRIRRESEGNENGGKDRNGYSVFYLIRTYYMSYNQLKICENGFFKALLPGLIDDSIYGIEVYHQSETIVSWLFPPNEFTFHTFKEKICLSISKFITDDGDIKLKFKIIRCLAEDIGKGHLEIWEKESRESKGSYNRNRPKKVSDRPAWGLSNKNPWYSSGDKNLRLGDKYEKKRLSNKKDKQSEAKKIRRDIARNKPNDKRKFSTSCRSYSAHYLEDDKLDMFKGLSSYFESKNFKVNNDTQIAIEKYLLDFTLSSEGAGGKKEDYLLHDINIQHLGGSIPAAIKDKADIIDQYIDKLLNNNLGNEALRTEILNSVGKMFIHDICVYSVLKILAHSNSNDLDKLSVVQTSIKIGKGILDKHLRIKKEIKEENKKIGYRDWVKEYYSHNRELADLLNKDDTFLSMIGLKIMDVLQFSGLVEMKTVTISRTERRMEYRIIDENLLKFSKKETILIPPIKLPMIVAPKPFTKDKLGGYLLNDVDYSEDMFTSKKQYKQSSDISADNKLFCLLNKTGSTPFKVNTGVLEFISSDLGSVLLVKESDLKEYEDAPYLSKYMRTKQKALVSKLVHQEYILKIAELFKKYDSIYFPVKIDHRGRLYCVPPYFNYQSSDLAKALILFSKPGIINKNYLDDAKYLKSYGVNCFGGSISKGSVDAKIKWVDDNLDNIINFDNGVLIMKAKEKLAFTAFCIEYKRYNAFLNDESSSVFDTYLPIQLDATCNGFQHLSMLSQESKLYEELNLTNKDKYPKDFYTFLLHKLLSYLKNKIEKGTLTGGKASYERLNTFVWSRSHVKKLIMTIPYNSTERSMKEYLISELVQIDYDKPNKCYWYCDIDKPNLRVNSHDITLLISIIKSIIKHDFTKIDKLVKYLRNVAKLFNLLNLPIYWSLPSGLKIYQSYLEGKSITISPFAYSKVKINLKVSSKDKFDHNKQIRALMPNLIHSLDAYSMTELYYYFSSEHKICQFYSIHDCFGTTTDKVESLKSLLVYVYVDLYSNNHYLSKFDKGIISYIKGSTNYEWKDRTIIIDEETSYELFDIDWVLNNKLISNKEIYRLDSQHILI